MKWPRLLHAAPTVPDLKTKRLRLRAITPAMLRADGLNDGSLAGVLGAGLTAEWPPEHWEPHVLEFMLAQFAEWPETLGWHRYVVLPGRLGAALGKATLIGAVGGFPKTEGDVEIGYSTLPAYQRQGYGTEAVRSLVEYLLGRDGVRSVSAQTTVGSAESTKVMERCGLVYVGAGDEDGTVRYRRMR